MDDTPRKVGDVEDWREERMGEREGLCLIDAQNILWQRRPIAIDFEAMKGRYGNVQVRDGFGTKGCG